LLLGIVLALPVRPVRWAAVPPLIGDAVRILATPAVALAWLFVLAHSGLAPEHPSGGVRALLLASYWGTLVLTAQRACTLAARVCRAVAAPSARRLRVATLLIGTGMALAAGQGLLAMLHRTPDGGSIAAFLSVAVLAAATIRAGIDLRRA
jgi:hypothetical protein